MNRRTVLTGLAVCAALAAGLYLGRYWHAGRAPLETAAPADRPATRPAGPDKAAEALLGRKGGGRTITVEAGQSIQAAVAQAQPGDTIRVMPGEYRETVYIDKDDITLFGVIDGDSWPTLEGSHTLNDAILYSGNGIRVENMKVTDYKGNAIMGQAGNNFVIRNNWIVNSGVYGIFPEYGRNGLIEGNVLSGIEDAAIYVGMSDNIDVVRNKVFASVAGIEIENTRHAIVEDNLATDNAGGILVFITPGLPIKTTFDVIVRDNFVVGNNHRNFGAPGSMVSGLPSGTGLVVMAAKDVILENNIIMDNRNTGIVITDHKSFANVTLDPQTDQTPARVQILDNFMSGNGTEPIKELKALMLAHLDSRAPDIVAVGEGKDNCVLHKGRYVTIGLDSYGACARASTADVISYLLPAPAQPRTMNAADQAKMVYRAICAGCHAYNARMIGPPVLVIQSLYADNPQGIADYIADPVKKRPDFPAMPPQNHLSPALRRAVADYMLKLDR